MEIIILNIALEGQLYDDMLNKSIQKNSSFPQVFF